MESITGRVIARNPNVNPANVVQDRRQIHEFSGTFGEVLSRLAPLRPAYAHLSDGRVLRFLPAEILSGVASLQSELVRIVQHLYPDLYETEPERTERGTEMRGFIANVKGGAKLSRMRIGDQRPIDTITRFLELVSFDHSLDVTIEQQPGSTRKVRGCFLFPRSELPFCLRPPGVSTYVFVRYNRRLLHARLNLGYVIELDVFGWKGVCEVSQDQRGRKDNSREYFREYLKRLQGRRLLNTLQAILETLQNQTEAA